MLTKKSSVRFDASKSDGKKLNDLFDDRWRESRAKDQQQTQRQKKVLPRGEKEIIGNLPALNLIYFFSCLFNIFTLHCTSGEETWMNGKDIKKGILAQWRDYKEEEKRGIRWKW